MSAALALPHLPLGASPDRVQARCDACGHNWKLHRHEAFTCPYCGNKPTEVAFYGNYAVLADETSQRWFT